MLQVSRSASILGALGLVALLGCITPAGARLAANGTSLNGTSLNGTSLNGISANGIGDLNGVAVEAIIIPEAAVR